MADATPNSGKLTVRLVTPERVLVDTTAVAVELPASTGYMEVLYGAAPLLADLGAGIVTLHGAENDGGEKFFVSQGFVEVLPTQVTILAETAMHPDELNANAAREELAEGEKLWKEAGDDADKYEDALAEIAEAEAKIAAAGGSAEKH